MKDEKNDIHNISLIESISSIKKSKIIPRYLYTLNAQKDIKTINFPIKENEDEGNNIPFRVRLNKKSQGKSVKKIEFLKKMNNAENSLLSTDKKRRNHTQNYKEKEKTTNNIKILSETSYSQDKTNPAEVIINKHKLIINYNNYKPNNYSNYQKNSCKRNENENVNKESDSIQLRNIILTRPIKVNPKIMNVCNNNNNEIIKEEIHNPEILTDNFNERKYLFKKKFGETEHNNNHRKRIVSSSVNKSIVFNKYDNVLKDNIQEILDEKNNNSSPYNLTAKNIRNDIKYKTNYQFYSNSSNSYGKYIKKYYQDPNLNNSRSSKKIRRFNY